MTDSNCYISHASDIEVSDNESPATLKSHNISCNNDPIPNASSDDNLNKTFVPYNENNAVTPLNYDLYEEIIYDNDVDSVDDIDAVNDNDDIVSLSSSVSSINESTQSMDACSVVLCNNFIRSHFETLFFINFPNNNISLRAKWWKICGRNDAFDPLSKICSIHFNANDFIIREQTRGGQRYRQTVLAYPGVIPTLYLQPHEYTKFIRKRKRNITTDDNRKEESIKVTETPKCAVESCKNELSNNNIKKLFFKFPLENKDLLEKWINNIGLANWQPLETDKICSDHFENHDITNNSNKYNLNKNALPLIKPENPYVMNSVDNNCKISEMSIEKKQKYEVNFDSDNIEFCKINADVLVVKVIKNREESDLLGSLENNKNNQQQNKDENTSVEPNLTDGNDNYETELNENSNNIDLELVYLDILNDDDVMEIQPIEDANDSLKKINSINENENNENIDLEYVYMDVLQNENVIEIQPTTNSKDDLKNGHKNTKLADISSVSSVIDTSDVLNRSHITSKKNTSTDKLEITKSDVFSSISTINNTSVKYTPNISKKSKIKSSENNICKDEQEKTKSDIFASVSTVNNTPMKCTSNMLKKTRKKSTEKCISKDQYNKIKLTNMPSTSTVNHTSINGTSHVMKKSQIKSTEQNISRGTPESIMFNSNLTETYGEMLPPYCTSECTLLCYYCIPGPERREIYKEFYKSPNVSEQNWKITQLVQLNVITVNDGSLKSCPSYSLIMDKESINVCRTFFINTLGITERRLDAVLIPFNYNWYFDRNNIILANKPKQFTEEPIITDFIRNSLPPLMKDYDLYEPESDEEVSLNNVPDTEYENVINYIKSIPRVLSRYNDDKTNKSQCFETSICVEYMFKTYSETYIKNNTAPPYTRRQFKKIYNQYMKNFFKKV